MCKLCKSRSVSCASSEARLQGDRKGRPIDINLSDLPMLSFASLRIWLDGAARSFAALRMTGLGLAVGEELSRAFEPCLRDGSSQKKKCVRH